jgi:hypothetical protein
MGFTEQLRFAPGVDYILNIYTRDPGSCTGPPVDVIGPNCNLRDNGFIWPTTPQNLYWYVEVNNAGAPRESAKLTTMMCPDPFNDLKVIPFHKDTREWNIFDVEFKPTRDILVGGALAVEFMTDNELEELFEVDLGHGLLPLVWDAPIDCMVQSGFGGATAG